MTKVFGYLCDMAKSILLACGVTDVTGEPILVASPDGDKGKKFSGSLGHSLGADKNGVFGIQAKVRLGNTVETATQAFERLAYSCMVYVERGSSFSPGDGEAPTKRIGVPGKHDPSRMAQAKALVARVSSQNPDHDTLFADALKALVNEATDRAKIWRRVYVYDTKTGNVIEPSFTVTTNEYGGQEKDSHGVLFDGEAIKNGNDLLTSRYQKFAPSLAVRSATPAELDKIKSRAGKKGADAKLKAVA